MSLMSKVRQTIPSPVKRAIKRLITTKYQSELAYWKGAIQPDQEKSNAYYRQYFLAMANEPDDRFMEGKVVADFGCGPQGSLTWATRAAIRIGIDVLSDLYADEFREHVIRHQMIYVKSTERTIPLPTNSVDFMLTFNAMDHVDNFEAMCDELIRTMKPGGEFIGSFNLEETPTICEPQTLSEARIRDQFLSRLDIMTYRVATRGPENDVYGPMECGELGLSPGQPGYLWVRARKRT